MHSDDKGGGLRNKIKSFFDRPRNMWLIIILISIAIMATNKGGPLIIEKPIPIMEYSEFEQKLKEGEIDQVLYSKSKEYMTVYPFNDKTRDMTPEEREKYKHPIEDAYMVKYPGGDGFRSELLKNGATPTLIVESDLLGEIMGWLSILLYAFLGIFLIAIVLKGPMGAIGKTQAALISKSDIRFKDVIGQDEVIDDLRFIVDLMKNPKIGDNIGAKIPKGLLLQGPPGTGKTLLAKAVAGEAGVPFISQSGSGFVEMYVGLGAKRVRDLFAMARKAAPCILFIDEIDAVGQKRGRTGSHSENDQTINALLEQMDGFNARDGIFVMAATNRAEELDDALVRPGRFDRQVTVGPPRDKKVREDMFRHYLGALKTDDTVDPAALAGQTAGFTGADIAAVCNEAGIIAAMKGAAAVSAPDLEEAVDKKIFMGSRSKRKHYERDRNITARHEAGHALMSWLLGIPVTRAGIQSTTSGVGGAVISEEPEGMFLTDKDIRQRVAVFYAGRIAEETGFGEVSTGASNDITKATELLRRYVESLGFDEDYGLIDINVLSADRLVNSQKTTETMRKISAKIREFVRDTLSKNEKALSILADELLEKESLSGQEIDDLLRNAGIEPLSDDDIKKL